MVRSSSPGLTGEGEASPVALSLPALADFKAIQPPKLTPSPFGMLLPVRRKHDPSAVLRCSVEDVLHPAPLSFQQCMPDLALNFFSTPHICPVYINFSFLVFFFFFRFQLSNGFYHCSLSSGPSLASVGAGPLLPHFPSVSHAWTRASSSTLLPDHGHYYTIGPGMFPSSKIPSWKVCVSFVSVMLSFSIPTPPTPFPFFHCGM